MDRKSYIVIVMGLSFGGIFASQRRVERVTEQYPHLAGRVLNRRDNQRKMQQALAKKKKVPGIAIARVITATTTLPVLPLPSPSFNSQQHHKESSPLATPQHSKRTLAASSSVRVLASEPQSTTLAATPPMSELRSSAFTEACKWARVSNQQTTGSVVFPSIFAEETEEEKAKKKEASRLLMEQSQTTGCLLTPCNTFRAAVGGGLQRITGPDYPWTQGHARGLERVALALQSSGNSLPMEMTQPQAENTEELPSDRMQRQNGRGLSNIERITLRHNLRALINQTYGFSLSQTHDNDQLSSPAVLAAHTGQRHLQVPPLSFALS